MTASIIAHNGLLRKEFYLAGYTCDLDDHVITIKRDGKIAKTIDGQDMRYGSHTDPEIIFKDIASAIETDKAVEIIPAPVRGFFDPGELRQALRESFLQARGIY